VNRTGDDPFGPLVLRGTGRRHILDIVYQIATMLGELEQIVLLAVLRVGDAAYGVPVHEEIVRLTKRDLTLGTVYKTLSRLEDKGFVRSYEGDPTPQRGGRRTRCFAVTNAGRKALESSLAALRRMAVGLGVGLEPT
jgi:PadR family transcriptional regulator, regulatory protein PadR